MASEGFGSSDGDFSGGIRSPGGFAFGVTGWMWAEPRPVAITFFLDGTAKVSDQYGRRIKGTVVDGKEVVFADGPPAHDDPPGGRYVVVGNKKELVRPATHAQVVRALAAERVDWQKLSWAGWPQLPYEELAALSELPPTPLEELRKIRDGDLRRAAIRARRERDEAMVREGAADDAAADDAAVAASREASSRGK